MKTLCVTALLLSLLGGCSSDLQSPQVSPDSALAQALERWQAGRTVEDFLLIVKHIPAGTPAGRVVSDYLGEPLRKQQMHANVPTQWYYILGEPPDGPICTVFVSRSDGTFLWGRDKRRTQDGG